MEKLKKSVYIETTIPSYATAKPSIDIISSNRQNLTKLYISQFVIDECRQGNADAAKRRLEFIRKGGIKCNTILKNT